MSNKPKKMKDLPLEEQEALAARYEVRAQVRAANAELVEVLRQWVLDGIPDYERFHAVGHLGQYSELPQGTLARKLLDLGWTLHAIEKAKSKETSLNYMDAEELAQVYQRIQSMVQYFQSQPSGTFADACAVYERFGELVRQTVIDQTGHPPEQYPTPQRRITGSEASSTYQVQPYRAPLFPTEEVGQP